MNDPAQETVLFIGIGFYDYEKIIIQSLRKKRKKIIYIRSRPRLIQFSILAYLYNNVKCICIISNYIYRKYILARILKKKIDKVLVINGRDMDPMIMKMLRSKLVGTEFILYLWDSIKRFPETLNVVPQFDRVLTFDRVDSLAHPNFIFRPLFFVPNEGLSNITNKDIDLSFIGWLHNGRDATIVEITKEANKLGLKMYTYLYTGFATWLKMLIRGRSKGIHFRRLNSSEVQKLLARSKCTLDLPHPEQSGLTMRAIESVGRNVKIITTSSDISRYPFYRHNNISIQQIEDIQISRSFIIGTFEPIPDKVIEEYSIHAWLSSVFDERM